MTRERLGLGTVALLLAGLAALAPLLLGPSALQLVGTLLIVAGVLEAFHSFRRVSQHAQRSAYASAGLTVAPFFQSFVEVRVEPPQGRVRLLPWGVHGRLRWVDLQASPGWQPVRSDPNDLVEIVLPMRLGSSGG